jgi:mono/diheme cytochrome c family protein
MKRSRAIGLGGLALSVGCAGGWLSAADARNALPDPAGMAVYQKWCAPCHAPGISHPGTNALSVKYRGVKSGVLLEWRDLPASTVKFWVRHGISVMPQFRKTEISDAELDALAQYLSRNTPGARTP